MAANVSFAMLFLRSCPSFWDPCKEGLEGGCSDAACDAGTREAMMTCKLAWGARARGTSFDLYSKLSYWFVL